MSQEECARLRESVPYVKLYRYNPKHLYPKLNGYGDNGQRSLKLEFQPCYVSRSLPVNCHHSRLGCLDLDLGNADWVESRQIPLQLTLWQQNTGQMQVLNDPCWISLNLQAAGCCGLYRIHLQLHLPLADHQPARTIIIRRQNHQFTMSNCNNDVTNHKSHT